jgi:hypothetical protein
VNSTEKNVVWVLAGLAGAGVLWFGLLRPRPVVVQPLVKPAPVCPGPNCPAPKKPDRRPWAASPAAGLVASAAPARVYGDAEPMVDLLAVPGRTHNISAKGAGCCTFKSMDYAARHQNVPAIVGLAEWLRSAGFAGGGYPQKEAQMIAKCAAARNMPCPAFVQYEGSDPWFIEAMLASGRSVGITWQANHMLSCVHLDAQQGAIVDNNAPDRVQWFPRQTFLSKWTAGNAGWAIALLNAPPPPVPSNLRPAAQSLPCQRKRCDCGCEDGEPCRCAAGVPAFDRCGCSPLCTCGCNAGGPCPCCPEAADEGGLEWVYGGRERFTFGADMRDMSRQEVEAWLAADAAKPHLTLIGDEPARKAVLDLIGAEADRYLVQGYTPDHWALQCGFATAQPVVYLQQRDGKVLLNRPLAGASGLAQKLRRADPTYQPSADPNGDALAGLSLDSAKQWATDNPLTALGGAGAAALAALYLRSKRGQPTGGTPAAATRPATQDDVAALLRQVLDRLPPRAA